MRRQEKPKRERASPQDEDLQRHLAVYRVLHERYVSNAGLQWQVAVYIIASQAALLAGVVAATSSLLRVALGLAAAVVGGLGILVCWRIELTAWIDREHLDRLEQRLIPEDPDFRLHHGDNFVARLERRGLSFADRNWIRALDVRVARHVRPGVGLAVLMAVLGLAGLLSAPFGS